MGRARGLYIHLALSLGSDAVLGANYLVSLTLSFLDPQLPHL